MFGSIYIIGVIYAEPHEQATCGTLLSNENKHPPNKVRNPSVPRPPQPPILPFPLSKNRLINSLSRCKNSRLEMLKMQSRLVFLKVVENVGVSRGAEGKNRKRSGGPKSPRRGRSRRVRGVGGRGRNGGAPQGWKMVEKGGVGNVKCVIIRHNSFGCLKHSSYIC